MHKTAITTTLISTTKLSTMMIRGCLFDLGGVVMGSPPLAIASYEKLHGIPSGFVNRAIVHHMPNGAFQKLERGEIHDLQRFYEDFTSDLESYREQHWQGDKSFPPINGKELFESMSRAGAIVDKDFYHALFCLRGHGIKVAALTNNFTPIASTPPLADLFHGIFDVWIESAVEGVRKPDPNAYLLACTRMSCKPNEITFMDDIRMNLKPARELGIETIHVPIENKQSSLVQLQQVIRERTTNPHQRNIQLLPPKDVSIPQRLSWKIPHETLLEGGELVADAFGHAANPPIVLLHGGGQTRHSWEETAITLAKAGYFALSVDLRGHGESFWDPDGNYLAFHISRDVDYFIEVAGLSKRRPVLCGASLGGLSSLTSAFAQSSDLGALVLVDVAPRLERAGVNRILEFMNESSKTGFASLEEAAMSIRKYKEDGHVVGSSSNNNNERASSSEKKNTDNNNNSSNNSSLEGLRKNLRFDEQKKRYFWHWDPKLMNSWVDTPKTLQISTPDDQFNLAFSERLFLQCARNITKPVCLIRGKLTDVVSEEGAQSLLQNVPHAVLFDVSGASHMVVGDENDAFSQALLTFLDYHRPSLLSAPGAPTLEVLNDGSSSSNNKELATLVGGSSILLSNNKL
jgi:epoxide hydrolase-like predicted phosphatase